MRILFDDDKGHRAAMDCSAVYACPDRDGGDGWTVFVDVIGDNGSVVVRTGLSESLAKRIVERLFDVGRYVHCP